MSEFYKYLTKKKTLNEAGQVNPEVEQIAQALSAFQPNDPIFAHIGQMIKQYQMQQQQQQQQQAGQPGQPQAAMAQNAQATS